MSVKTFFNEGLQEFIGCLVVSFCSLVGTVFFQEASASLAILEILQVGGFHKNAVSAREFFNVGLTFVLGGVTIVFAYFVRPYRT